MSEYSDLAGRVILKPRKAMAFFARHPWVQERAIERIEGEPGDGAEVALLTHDGKFIARGLYNGRSRIRVRLYRWDGDRPLDAALWRARLESALALRRQIGYDDPDGAARLVFSEADGLSGLIVDRYARHLVVQPTALAMAERLQTIVPILVELTEPQSVTIRPDEAAARWEGIAHEARTVHGAAPTEPVTIREHGIAYAVDLLGGQKTGLYLDQRENRLAAARFVRGRRVLDMFCYCGGFSLAAALVGGAAEVLGIDSSAAAVEAARRNAALAGARRVRFETGDAFATLDRLVASGERFGAVILDPPKFARSRRNLDAALRAYHRLNRQAVELLEPGGILITFSCSGSVGREEFIAMLFGVSLRARRPIQILEQRGAAPDHPLDPTCPENEYLKCCICRVGGREI